MDALAKSEALKRAEEDKEAFRADLTEARSRKDDMEIRLNEAAGEKTRFENEIRQLRTELSIEQKQRGSLQLRLVAQKEELEARFATERMELGSAYQKHVDEMYFFGYRCCMKKNGIKRDVPSIPPGEEDKLRGKPSQ